MYFNVVIVRLFGLEFGGAQLTNEISFGMAVRVLIQVGFLKVSFIGTVRANVSPLIRMNSLMILELGVTCKLFITRSTFILFRFM